MLIRQQLNHPFFVTIVQVAMTVLLWQRAAAQSPEIVWSDTLLAGRLLDESKKLNRTGQSAEALEKARQALDIYTALYGENHVKPAAARMFVARELRNRYQTTEAKALFEQSLTAFEAASDTPQMARCHFHLGLCYRTLGRYADSGRSLQTAIDLLQPDSIRQASLLTDFRFTLGTLLIDQKNYLAAIPLMEAAKTFYIGANNFYYQGLVAYHLGNAFFGLQDYTRAKEHFFSSQANLAKELPPSHPFFADLLVETGKCFQKTGDPATALSYMLEALAAYRKYHPDDRHIILIMQDLGAFYLEQKEYSAAIEQLELCLAEKEKAFGPQSNYLLNTLRELGAALTGNRQFGRAEMCFRRGMQIIAGSLGNNSQMTWPFQVKLAELRYAQNDFYGSMALCDSAFATGGFDPANPGKMLPRDHFRELCLLYARSLRSRYQQTADKSFLTRAEQYFALAVETLFREVEEISVNSSREIVYDREYLILEEWLAAQMALYEQEPNPKNAEKAFRIAAQGKAFLLAGAMRRSGALKYANLPDSVLQQEYSLRARIAAAEKKLETPDLRRGVAPDSAVLAISRDISAWRSEYDVLIERISRQYPDYYRLRSAPRSFFTAGLRRRLAPDQAMLMYGRAGARLYAFVLTRDSFYIRSLSPGDTVNNEVEGFRKALTEYHTTIDPADDLYDRNLETAIDLGQSLYRRLILPVAGLLPGRIIIVPEGNLWYLPFEALLAGAPADADNFRTYPFLFKEKAISYALSPDFQVETALAPPLKAGEKWLGLAPFSTLPAAGNNSSASRALPPADSFPPLPFSGKEVADIAALVQGDAWLGADAQPGRFRSEAARYRMLHLATHSCADDRQGDYSWLAVAGSGEILPAKDLYQFSLAAEMVVLSACESGGGKLLRGEGIIGLVRAFSFAGARSVVATLWVANDQSTTSLMVEFYRNLKRGLPKDLALKAARMDLLKQASGVMHPFYWAGFRLYGHVAPLW
ncbi:MAG: CHAT domain-containing protein [Thermoanaerobaculia bacterium]|nr:CHAT domain-containing protein [Thermoanaerobaculia bacterium]